MKVLVCGDRNWTDVDKIEERLSKFMADTIFIEGECTYGGADIIAREVAEEFGFEVLRFPADWERYGRAAGPIRNSQMLAENPDLVLAFHSNLAKSKGTADTLRKAHKMGITTEVIT